MPVYLQGNYQRRVRIVTIAFLLSLGGIFGCSGDHPAEDDASSSGTAQPATHAVEQDARDFGSDDYDPIGDRSLDIPYPPEPHPDDTEILGRFMEAFRKGDLDGVIDSWAQMSPAQRLRAREQGTEYRFSVSSDDDELYEAVQDPYDLLGTADYSKLHYDATADERGEPRIQPVVNEPLELPEDLGHVRGRVVDRETGEPVAGVNVAASFPQIMLFMIAGEATRWETISDADGRFEIRDIPAGEAALVLQRLPEYNLLQHNIEVLADQTSDETVELKRLARIKLELPTFLAGTVIDKDSREPVPGVLVSIGNSSMTGRSNATGAYIIRKIPLGEHTVLARHEDYHDGSEIVVAEGPGKVELDFRIAPITTGIVVGTAVNQATGEPLANVTVTIAGQTVTTDSQGRFRIADIESGDIRVQAGSEGFRPTGSDISLAARTTAETVLELDPITEGTVRGVVRNASSGEPLGETAIQIGPFDTLTDSAGRFEIAKVPQGDANVVARKTLFETGMTTVDVVAMKAIDVAIDLIPITYGDLVVTVTDASNGAPIASSVVTTAGNFSGKTDTQGRIRFEKVPAGDGLISASKHAYVPGEAGFRLEPGTEVEQTIALQPVTVGLVAGVVRSTKDGTAIAGANVTIGNRSVQTDEVGHFEIVDVAAGTVTVSAGKAVFESGSTSVEVIAAERVSVEIELEPVTYGSIEGVVVDALTSKPIADVVVSVSGRNTRTDSGGRFLLERVSAGDVVLAATKRVYEQVEERFVLEPAETATRRIALPPITYGEIQGRVVDADTNAPLAAVDVVLGTTRVRTDAQGRFGPERVDAGPLNVSARKTGFNTGGLSVDVAAADLTDALVMLEPLRVGTVIGTVLDARTGAPVRGARVTLGQASMETTDGGRFRFEDVRTGSVGVAVRHADYGNGAASGDLDGGATLELVVRVELRREDVTQLEAGLAAGGSIDLYGIHFDSGKDQFKPSSLGTLNAVLEVMKRAPNRSFMIAGHTDSDGTDASNQALSERRAQTVIRWLIEHGIEARRLQGAGFGESRPTAPNDTEAGKALNRRVELSFSE